MNILLSIGIAQGLFLVLLLLGKKENRQANLILATIMFLYSLYIAQSIAMGLGIYNVIPHILSIGVGIPILFGPFHYFYVRALVYNQSFNIKKDFAHFLLYFLNWAVYLPYFLKSPSELTNLIVAFNSAVTPTFTIGIWIITMQGLVYMFFSLKLIKTYYRQIKWEYSSLEKINLNWLRNITLSTLIVWITVFIKNVIMIFYTISVAKSEIYIALGVSILIYIMGYLGLYQSEIFSPNIETPENPSDKRSGESKAYSSEAPAKKYQKSGLSLEKARHYLEDLIALIERDKVYRHNNLTLKDLAKRLGISPHNLSEIMNTQLNQSFFDYINSCRVNDVKTAMKNPENNNYTLLSMALEAGFNSKSSFNAIFKKHTNMTPSQYRKQASF